MCPCGALVDTNSLHGISCKLNSGKHAKHANFNELIYHALKSSDIPAVKESTGLSRSDGKRPDGLSLVPWKSGKCLIWDVTIVDTMAQSYLQSTSQNACAAAEMAAERKHNKYVDLEHDYMFVPVAFESFGSICKEGRAFISEIGRRLSLSTGEVRETSFLFQRLSVSIQHFNHVLFCGSFNNYFDRHD